MAGILVHTKPNAMDIGLQEWNLLLKEYSPADKPDDDWTWRWRKADRAWLEEWLNLPNTGVHHFLRQLAKIPSGDVCCEKRVLQIAYNLGQLVGSGALYSVLRDFKVDVNRMMSVSSWIEPDD